MSRLIADPLLKMFQCIVVGDGWEKVDEEEGRGRCRAVDATLRRVKWFCLPMLSRIRRGAVGEPIKFLGYAGSILF